MDDDLFIVFVIYGSLFHLATSGNYSTTVLFFTYQALVTCINTQKMTGDVLQRIDLQSCLWFFSLLPLYTLNFKSLLLPKVAIPPNFANKKDGDKMWLALHPLSPQFTTPSLSHP